MDFNKENKPINLASPPQAFSPTPAFSPAPKQVNTLSFKTSLRNLGTLGKKKAQMKISPPARLSEGLVLCSWQPGQGPVTAGWPLVRGQAVSANSLPIVSGAMPVSSPLTVAALEGGGGQGPATGGLLHGSTDPQFGTAGYRSEPAAGPENMQHQFKQNQSPCSPYLLVRREELAALLFYLDSFGIFKNLKHVFDSLCFLHWADGLSLTYI